MPSDRALLIDLDGVIRTWRSQDNPDHERGFGLPPGSIAQVAFTPERLVPAITGQVTDSVWRAQIAAELARLFPAADVAGAVAWWSASPGETVPQVVELVHTFRRSGQVVLVTNATTRLADDLNRLGISTLFDRIVNSALVGVAKPSPAIFTAALEAAGVVAENALFVDDQPTNITAAQTLGIPAHLYVGIAEFEAALFAHRHQANT